MKLCYLVVEGPHDTEMVGRLLKELWQFRRIQQMDELQSEWEPLVPKTFPHGGDLLRRVPVPTFFASQTHSVAVHAASGGSKIAGTIEESLVALDRVVPEAVAAIIDADHAVPVRQRFDELVGELQRRGVEVPDAPGVVASGRQYRTGVFVLPDSASAGTLEDVLLACADINYKPLADCARTFVQDASGLIDTAELEELRKPAGKSKATVSAMASMLRPGKAIQVSIQKDRWFDGDALALHTVRAIGTFLASLLDLPFESKSSHPREE